VESLRRELKRNGQLRELCGFDPLKGLAAVPESWNYSRFLDSLLEQYEALEAMFDAMVEKLQALLPDFGKRLAADGKAILSFARGRKKEEGEAKQEGKRDRRRDCDADWGVHSHRGVRQDGSAWEKVMSWFGYKLHLLVDASYELPVGFTVTKASASELKQLSVLLETTGSKHPELLNRAEQLAADKAYDDGKLLAELWDSRHIIPLIDIRNCWQDGEQTKLAGGQENVVYDYRGTVSCVCPATGQMREMAYGGFEEDRMTLKYRCPARHYGMECAGLERCPIAQAVRIPLSEDRRIFTPVARSSYKWQRLYCSRTAVERVNSRLDVCLGFERHTIRGLRKMKVRCALALVVMLTLAYGRILQNQRDLMRSLTKAG